MAEFETVRTDPYANKDEMAEGQWGDTALSAASGAANLLGGMAAIVRDIGESGDEGNNVARATEGLGEIFQAVWNEAGATAEGAMSPKALRDLQSTVTDPNFWTLNSLTLKGANMAPAVVAAVIPTTIFPGVMAASLAAAGTGGAFSAGDYLNQTQQYLDNLSDADLQKEVPQYRQYRESGMAEDEARRRYSDDFQGNRPLMLAALGAVTSTFGAAGQAARGFGAKAGASLLADAEAGVAKRALHGVAEGAVSEGIQSGGETYAMEDTLTAAGRQEGIDYGNVATAAGTGAVLGGVLGGGISAAAGRPRTRTVVEEALEPSTSVVNPAPVSTDTGPATGPAVEGGTVPTPVVQAPVAAEVATDTPVADTAVPGTPVKPRRQPKAKVQVVDAAGPDATQAAALASTEVETPARMNPNSASDVAEAVDAVSQPQTAVEPSPVVEPPVAPEATPGAPVAEPAPIQTPPVADVAPVQPEPVSAQPVADTAPVSVTPEVAPPAGPRILEDRTTAANTTALNDQVARNIKAANTEATGPVGKKRSQAQLDAREAMRSGATEIAAKFQPSDGEAGIMAKAPKEITAAKRLLLDRAKAISDEADARGLSVPKRLVDNADEAANFNADTLLVMEARRLATKKNPTKQDFFRFYEREVSLRKGDLDQVKSERRTEGDIAMRRGGENAETQIDQAKTLTSDDTNPEARIIARDEASEEGRAEGDEDTNYRATGPRQEDRPLTAAEKRQADREAKARAVPPVIQEVFDREIKAALEAPAKPPVVEKVKRRVAKKPEPAVYSRAQEIARDYAKAEKGVTIRFSENVGYATANREYVVTDIEKSGRIHIKNKDGSGTSLSYPDLLGAQKRGVVFERVTPKVTPPSVQRIKYGQIEITPTTIPEVANLNRLREWVDGLSDADFNYLAEKQTGRFYGFPQMVGNASPDPQTVNNLLKVWKETLEERDAKAGPDKAKRVLESVNERIEAARQKTNTNPTDAQKEAGNYAKGKVSVNGHTIAIENPVGTARTGVGPDGKPWSNKMPADYGYIVGSKGADGDAIDVYLGPDHDAPYVYVVDQLDPETFAFDEHKVLMGFKSLAVAQSTYDRAFSDNKPRAGDIRKMTQDEFKRWLEGNTTKRAGATEADIAQADAASFLTEEELNDALGVSDPRRPYEPGMVTDPTTNRHAMPKATYRAADVMARIDASAMNGFEKAMFGNVRRILTSAVGDVDVHVLSGDDLNYISRAVEQGVNPRGYYVYDERTGKGQVFIRDDQFSDPGRAAHVVLHEVTHAATLKAINSNRAIEEEIQTLMRLTKRGMAQAGLERSDYAMTSPIEFVAEAFSNPEFQKLLGQIRMPDEMAARLGVPARGVLRTVWDMFTASVRKALGIPSSQTSLLEAAIRTTERTMRIQQASEKAGTGYSSFLIDPRASMQAAQDKVSDMLGREVEGLQRNRGNARLLRIRTMDNIARAADRIFGERNPIRKIANLMESQRVAVIKRMDAVAPMIQKLYDLEKKYTKARGENGRTVWENFAGLVTDETMSGVYADRPLADQKHITKNGYRDAQKRAQHAELARRYEALPEELKQARQEAMDYFRNTQNEMSQKLMENRVLHVLGIEGAQAREMAARVFDGKETDADKAALGEALDAIKAAGVLKKIEGPYFPLMRRGNWVVKGTYDIAAPAGAKRLSPNEFEFTSREEASDFASAQGTRATARTVYVDKTTGDTLGVTADGTQVPISANDMNAEPRFRVTVQDRHVEMFDTQAEARRRAAELTAAGIKTDDVVPRRYENFGVQTDMLSSQMQRLMGVLERKADQRNYTDQQKHDLMSAMNEMSLHMLAATRIQTRNLPRQFVEGASRDLVRNTTDYSQSTANYLSKLDFKPRLDAAVKEMHEIIKENSRDGFSTARQQMANEVEKRLTQGNPAVEGGKTNAVVQRILAFSFLDKLMSPAYSMVNAAQPFMTTAPVLASHFGPGRVFGAISKAFNDVGSIKSIREGLAATWDKASNPSRVPTDPVSLIRSRLKSPVERALIDFLIERGIIDTDAGLEVGKLVRRNDGIVGSLDGGIGYLEGIARQMPKTVEAINRTVSALAAFRLEMERSGGDFTRSANFAQDIVNQTQFNYSASNAPPFMNHPMLRLVTQFKKYGIGMYQLLGEQAAIAIRNEKPGDRAQAIKALSYTIGMHVLAAGAMGLPTEPLKFALMAAHGLGVTDWNWEDVEEAQRNLAADYLGVTMGEMLTRGVSRGIGVDLSSRMGIDSLVGPFGEPRTDDEQGWKAYLWDTIAGAPASLPVDWVKGVHSLAEGDVVRGMERLVPIKAFSDTVRAYRQMTEGTISEKSGKQVMSPYSFREGLVKSLGFAPAREAEAYERSGTFYRERDRQVETRSDFSREWSQASGAARGRIWRDIQRWNKTQPAAARITLSELKGYRKRMESDMKATKEGIRARKREQHILDRTDSTYNFE